MTSNGHVLYNKILRLFLRRSPFAGQRSLADAEGRENLVQNALVVDSAGDLAEGVEDRGQVFACDPLAAAEVVAVVRRNTAPGVPVFAKLSPDVTDIVEVASACVAAVADGLSMIEGSDTTDSRSPSGPGAAEESPNTSSPEGVRRIWV